jgi:hypothetical protein
VETSQESRYIFDKYIERGVKAGLIREAKWVILLLGTKRLGPPPREIDALLSIIDNRDRLEGMIERILDVTSWEELIASKGLLAELYEG